MSEEQVRTAIQVYMEEHRGWDVDRIMSYFDDNAVILLRGSDRHEGKEAVRKLLEGMAARNTDIVATHTRIIIQGDEAAGEWETTGRRADGSEVYMTGCNVYEVKNGKITYLKIYRDV